MGKIKCKVCRSNFHESPDNLVLCEHKKGFAHLGCCVSNCSMHGAPCDHALAQYNKL